MALNDTSVVCKFSRDYMTLERYEMLFGADFEDLLAVGDRIVTLERHFNNQQGFDRVDDADLPYDLPDFQRPSTSTTTLVAGATVSSLVKPCPKTVQPQKPDTAMGEPVRPARIDGSVRESTRRRTLEANLRRFPLQRG